MNRQTLGRVTRAGLVFAAALAVAAVSAQPALAGPATGGTDISGIPGFSPDIARRAVDTVVALTGVSRTAAVHRLAAQHDQTALGERMAQRLGARTGGFWLDRDDGTVVVGVTDADAAATVRAAGAHARLVSRSAADLDAVDRQLTALSTPGTVIGTDVVANQVVVTVSDTARGTEALLASAAKFGAAVRVAHVHGAPGLTIAGGHPIVSTADGIRCSLGFNLTGGFALTAGHCTAAVPEWANGNNNKFFGPSVRVNFPETDFGLIRNDGNLNQFGSVFNYSTGGMQDVTGAANNFVGQIVCKSGSTSGTTCARIEALNVTAHYAEGTVNGLVQANLCSAPGDSGGAVFDGGTAKGLISGGITGTCTTFFQPVLQALRTYNLFVLT
jgi:streptogrisin D